MLIVLIALFAVAMVAPLIFRVMDRSGFLVLAAVPAAGFIWLCTQLPHILASDELLAAGSGADGAGDPLVQTFDWLPSLGVQLSFRMDTLAAFMGLIVLGVGALVLVYCARYFSAGDPKLGSFGAVLLAFAGAMFGLVTTDDLLILYIFWEITSVLSFLLIGHAGHRIFARRSALTALVVTTFGGLAMLIGLLMLGEAAQTYRISDIVLAAPEMLTGPYSGAFMGWAIALVLIGALTKSAQVPFHFWLPAAMAAPTPVSAYLHAAAMVKAGIYLVARLAPGFADMATWQGLVLGVGMWTMLVGGWRALRQTDIKLVLAYGTVSQLGFLMIANGFGYRDAAMAGLAMLLAHSLFKAPLFMIVGTIDKKAGTRDLTKLSGLWRSQPWLFACALVGAASMAGIPPLFGFLAKESVLEQALHWAEVNTGAIGDSFWHAAWMWAPLVAIVIGSVFTVAYTARFIWGGFATKPAALDPDVDVATLAPNQKMADTELSRTMSWLGLSPVLLLSLACLVLPFVPEWTGALPTAFGATAAPLQPDDEPAYLALWHGFNVPLLLSGVILVLGLGAFLLRDRVSAAQAQVPTWFDAARAYRTFMGKLDAFGVWVTGRTQRGELSFYLFIILGVTVGGPLIAMLFPWHDDEGSVTLSNVAFFADWQLTSSPALIVVVLAMITATFTAMVARKRFMTIMLVSVTGYGLAAIFALQGAPDLALTQLLVESIILVAMVLGLRVLPARVEGARGRNDRWARALLAVSFGLVMMWVAATVLASRVADPISLDMPQLAYDIGGGSNVVNVILVDIRAWDTFGEITVLAAAATGVASLVFIQQRDRRRRQLGDIADGSVGRVSAPQKGIAKDELDTMRRFATVERDAWLVAGRTLAPERRSIIFEVVTRLIFHAVIVLSIYLLLAGHNTPGGGFAGGLIAGLALTIRYLAGGRYELEQALPVPAGVVLGSGLAIAAISGVVPLFFGGQVFQSYDLEATLPLFGYIHPVSSVAFDVGVYLVVVGLVVDVLRSLGSEVDRRAEADTRSLGEAERRRRQARRNAAARAAAAQSATAPNSTPTPSAPAPSGPSEGSSR